MQVVEWESPGGRTWVAEENAIERHVQQRPLSSLSLGVLHHMRDDLIHGLLHWSQPLHLLKSLQCGKTPHLRHFAVDG